MIHCALVWKTVRSSDVDASSCEMVAMASPVEIRVRFFGKARELMACEETRATIPCTMSYQELKNLIFKELYVDLESIESACILAVDHTYLSDHSTVSLRPYSEVAIIPPLSGG